MKRLSKPPFRYGRLVALAYVAGKYWAPGPKPPTIPGYLVLYLGKADPRLTFVTVKASDGDYVAYSVVNRELADVAQGLIVGWIKYGVPFDQWCTYPIGPAEEKTLRNLRIVRDYAEADRSLCAVLWQARIGTYYLSRSIQKKLHPMFALKPRSAAAIKSDVEERSRVKKGIWPKALQKRGLRKKM